MDGVHSVRQWPLAMVDSYETATDESAARAR